MLIEQTYVLEGSLVDKEGPDTGLEVGPGEFVWRPAGSRHVAWCPKGGTMIAIFQVPNKFFEKDGKVTDLRRYSLKDGNVVDYSSRITPTKGRELTFLQQLFNARPGAPASSNQGENTPGGGGGPPR